MNTVSKVMDMLCDDIVSYGLLAQIAEIGGIHSAVLEEKTANIICELLSSGDVEIGEAKLISPAYVEFCAWRGTVNERITRAMNAVDRAADSDREFAFWLCLSGNVDRFEDNDSLA